MASSKVVECESNVGEKQIKSVKTVTGNRDSNRVENVQVQHPTCHLVSKTETPIRKKLIERGVVRENLNKLDKKSIKSEEKPHKEIVDDENHKKMKSCVVKRIKYW